MAKNRAIKKELDTYPPFPKSFKAWSRYGTLTLWEASGGDGVKSQNYFVECEGVGINILITIVGLADEQYDDETVYDCEFVENYYNYETEDEKEWDNGWCTLSVDKDGYSDIDIGYTLSEGIDSVISKSAKKSKKVKTMAKNRAIRKKESLEERIDDWAERVANDPTNWIVGTRGTDIRIHLRGYERWFNIMDIITEQDVQQAKEYLKQHPADWSDSPLSYDYEFGEISEEEYNKYSASTKKSMNKSKYSDIHKRLAKLGGFTKDEEEIEIDDDDVVEIEEEDGGKKVEIESKEDHEKEVENGEESDDDNLNECNRNVKSRKTSKGMRTSKKRVKMKKGEDMPEDADDQQDQNEKGSGSAGKELPEDADEQQEINEKGSGSAGSELPEDADEQQNIKESARKARLARMQRAMRKSVNRPPVKKFSVTNGGSPDQTSYNGRYQQAPMVRDAIDGHMSSRANKSFDEIAMMNERIANLQKSKRNPSSNNGVPKRVR